MFEIFKNKNDDKNKSYKHFKHRILKTDIFKEPEKGEESIVFGCGCFWGAEKCFWKLPGVITTSVGYSGGKTTNPTYNDVCSGYTGHAEVVKVVWDKKIIDISDLLKMFWECHDPTQINRQGNDCGTQYRSAIYFYNNEQEEIITKSQKAYQKALEKNNFGKIETEIKKINTFFYAEEYHQQYLASFGSRQYCSASPTKIKLKEFENCNYKLKEEIWENFNWEVDKCVLISNNDPIT
tara:strand:+ start:250 stop:960 length:711 start_codon:yes stop_codon:yes gene_type:complete